MPEEKDGKHAMRWFVTVIASSLFVFSTIKRVIDGQGADITICTVFITLSGLIWGANIADYFKKIS